MSFFVHLYRRSIRQVTRTLGSITVSLSVFDGPFTLEGPADHVISQFDYLNSSARLEAARVRSVVDAMYRRYPLSGRAALRDWLRSRDDVMHLGAFFELVVHELVRRAGGGIVAIEPNSDSGVTFQITPVPRRRSRGAVLSTEAAEWLRRDPVPGHERVAAVSRNVKLAGNVVEVGDSQ